MTETSENKQAARKKKIKAHTVKYGKAGLKLAIQAGIIYAVSTISGFFLGGIGGYWISAHFMLSTWLTIGSSLLGMIAGSVLGFFLAQIIIIGIAQDILLEAGIKTGKTGFAALLKLIREKNI